MFFAGNGFIWYLIIFCFVKHSEQKSCCKQTDRRTADQGKWQISLFISRHNLPVGTATVQITSFFQCQIRTFFRISGYFMVFMEILDCPTVRYIMSLKMPLTAQYFFHQISVGTAWLPIRAVICTHHRFHTCLHTGLKSGQISFPHVFSGGLGIKMMSFLFRTGMYRKMLCTRRCF